MNTAWNRWCRNLPSSRALSLYENRITPVIITDITGRRNVRIQNPYTCTTSSDTSPSTEVTCRNKLRQSFDINKEQWKRDARLEFKILLVGMVVPGIHMQYMHVSSSLSSVSLYYNYRRHSVYFSILCPVCVSIAELYVVLEVLSVLHPS